MLYDQVFDLIPDILYKVSLLKIIFQLENSKSIQHDISVTGSKMKCITSKNVYLSYHISENPISW